MEIDEMIKTIDYNNSGTIDYTGNFPFDPQK